MPELPEVETVLRGIRPYLKNQQVKHISVREPRLRWQISPELVTKLPHQNICDIKRRGKYLLFVTDIGTLIIHLGMSGHLRLLTKSQPPQKHDHVDIYFRDQFYLRYTDPRRFGALLWTDSDPAKHPLIAKLGPEPLTEKFNGNYLHQKSRNKKVTVKQLLMDNHIVVGIGNIYATETLFLARVHPQKLANQLTKSECENLCQASKQVLKAAIKKGGTTLKDFHDSTGKPGYFEQDLKVYGRAGMPCINCQQTLNSVRIQQRSTVFCEHCQT